MDQTVPSVQDLADELADCLQRFLTANADERTMRRAQEALTLWRIAALDRDSVCVP